MFLGKTFYVLGSCACVCPGDGVNFCLHCLHSLQRPRSRAVLPVDHREIQAGPAGGGRDGRGGGGHCARPGTKGGEWSVGLLHP
jgi:hypothetical protein